MLIFTSVKSTMETITIIFNVIIITTMIFAWILQLLEYLGNEESRCIARHQREQLVDIPLIQMQAKSNINTTN